MTKEGYVSLAGPLDNNPEIEIIIFNTSSIQEADSLAHLNPLVDSRQFKVEIYIWTAGKGGKLN